MALKTGKDYVESLKAMNTVVYVAGEKVTRFYEHPALVPAVNTVAAGYDLAHDPNHAEITTAVSLEKREDHVMRCWLTIAALLLSPLAASQAADKPARGSPAQHHLRPVRRPRLR